MDMRSEIDASDAFSGDVDVAVMERPTRPTRRTGTTRSVRPMQLNNPIVDPVKPDTAKAERPSRPKSVRCARVLEPDQVAASKGEDYTQPQSNARDEMLGVDEDVQTSKIGAVVQSFGQIAARLKTSKSEAMPKETEGAKDVVPEVEAEDETSIAKGGVLGSLRAMVARTKSDDPAPMPKTDVEVADVHEQDYDAYPDDMDVPAMAVAPKQSFMVRFDTPVIGVLAAVALSTVGLMAVSAVLA